jgi:hypothetical protein
MGHVPRGTVRFVPDRRRESEYEREEQGSRPPEPAPPLQVGTLDWASAVGNQAVARLARQTAEEAPAEAEAAAEPEMGEEAPEAEAEEPVPEELPDELPE